MWWGGGLRCHMRRWCGGGGFRVSFVLTCVAWILSQDWSPIGPWVPLLLLNCMWRWRGCFAFFRGGIDSSGDGGVG